MDPATELFQAIHAGDMTKLQELLDADPGLAQARNPSGVSALLWAQYHQRQNVLDALRAKSGPCDLFEAAALGLLERVQELVRAHPEQVNAVSPDGFSPLGLACFFGRKEVVAFLVEQGAQVNAASRNAMTVRPLHSAVANRDAATALAMARSLLEGGADPNVAQQGAWTPLHQAAAHGNTDLVRLLLDRGADATPRAENGQTPAQIAVQNGHAEAAAMLEARENRRG